MGIIVVTGSGGLVGSETAAYYLAQGREVVGIDNDMRSRFFGNEASTRWQVESLCSRFPQYKHYEADIRDADAIRGIFRSCGASIELVVHTAAQPSHDWAASDPRTDFEVNALGTLVLLEATRELAAEATFIFTSTNKVYGDTPNRLPLIEQATRWEIDPAHPYAAEGIDETMSIDQTKHSVFGASKVAADVMVQEYGRYFGILGIPFTLGVFWHFR